MNDGIIFTNLYIALVALDSSSAHLTLQIRMQFKQIKTFLNNFIHAKANICLVYYIVLIKDTRTRRSLLPRSIYKNSVCGCHPYVSE